MLKKVSNFLEFTSPHSTNEKFVGKSYKSNSKFDEAFDFLSLIKSWPDVAGKKLSEHTIPLKNQNGNLIILSNHAAFANELKFMELPLKKKIFSIFPELQKHIKTISFIVDSTHFNQQLQVAQTITKSNIKKNLELPHPHSPEFKKLNKEAEELFNEIEDSELKKEFISLYIQHKCNKN